MKQGDAQIVEARIAALNDAERVDLRRRNDICSGVIQVVKEGLVMEPLFFERRELRTSMQKLQKIKDRSVLIIMGWGLVGGAIYWSFNDTSQGFQLTWYTSPIIFIMSFWGCKCIRIHAAKITLVHCRE